MMHHELGAIENVVQGMIDSGALFALSDSGGKDSQAMRLLLREIIPRNQLVVIHASLGDVE